MLLPGTCVLFICDGCVEAEFNVDRATAAAAAALLLPLLLLLATLVDSVLERPDTPVDVVSP